MVPLAVIVGEVFSNGPPKMGLPEWNDPIEAFALDGQDKSLRIGVQVWAPRRQQQRLHACPSQHLPELLRVQRISVEDQVPLSAQELPINSPAAGVARWAHFILLRRSSIASVLLDEGGIPESDVSAAFEEIFVPFPP